MKKPQANGRRPPLPRADIRVVHTPSGHQLFIPLTAAGEDFIRFDLMHGRGRFKACMLLDAEDDDDGVYVEMEELNMTWCCRECGRPARRMVKASLLASRARSPRRLRRTRAS